MMNFIGQVQIIKCSFYDVFIVVFILEREVKKLKDMQMIVGIIYNCF